GEMYIVRETRDDHSFDHLVRILVQNLPILERARLRFVRIADQVNRFAAFPINKRPLQSAREPRPAATTQARYLHFIADLLLGGHRLAVWQRLGGDSERFLERFVATMAQIAVQVVGVTWLINIF